VKELPLADVQGTSVKEVLQAISNPYTFAWQIGTAESTANLVAPTLVV
jgi:hypothetical protein